MRITRLIFIVLIFCPLFLFADQGQFQASLGGGAYFPLYLNTNDKTVIVFTSWNATGNIFFGLLDDFDFGFQYGITRIKDTNRSETYNNIEGTEYFNYLRMHFLFPVKWNIFPGLDFRPHIIAGPGFEVETFREREFYNSSNDLIDTYNKPDYSRLQFCVIGGVDLQYKIFDFVLVSVQTLYSWSPHGQHIELNALGGVTFFINSYYF